jgi:hypothetical protein
LHALERTPFGRRKRDAFNGMRVDVGSRSSAQPLALSKSHRSINNNNVFIINSEEQYE